MVATCLEEIKAGKEIRQNLIRLRELIKEETEQRKLAYLLQGEFSILTRLLEEDDPKIRKNAARILGMLENEDVLPVLYRHYEKEQTLFVRSDYLEAMKDLDYTAYLPRLKQALTALQGQEFTDTEKKHRYEEIRVLQKLIREKEKEPGHRFCGENYQGEWILTVNRNFREITANALDREVTMLQGGILAREIPLEKIRQIRTWSDLAFPIPCKIQPDMTPEMIGTALAKSKRFYLLLQELHEGAAPYYYRVELKNEMSLEKRSIFLRRLTSSLDHESAGQLINSPGNYEIEIRLIARKDGSYLPMLKTCLYPDLRFHYWQEKLAASLSPVNAALMVELSAPYLTEEAQVLDPFCGVGTLLIERNYKKKARSLYGLDIFGEAILKAKHNTAISGMKIQYIQRDFFDFRHEYLFDEIITDLPAVTRKRTEEDIEALYRQFLAQAPKILKKEGVLILYTASASLLEKAIGGERKVLLKEKYVFNEKTGAGMYILTLV